MKNHAKINIGPSSAHRWLECPASPNFIVQNADNLPDETTEFAEEGKIAHALAAEWLTEVYVNRDNENSVIKIPQIDDVDMHKHIKNYVDMVTDKMLPHDETFVKIESRIPLWYLPERSGYIDCVIINPTTKVLEIIDLKYGMGVSVDAVRNPQLMIYAESFIQEYNLVYDFNDKWTIKLSIYQPRDRNDSNGLREWTISRKDLTVVASIIEELAQSISDNTPDLPFVPNPDHQCKFCSAQSICKAYAGHVLGVVPMENEIIKLPNPNAFDRSKRVKVLEVKDALVAWLEELEKIELHALMNDAPELGFKVVEGRTHRKWADAEQAAEALKNILGDNIYEDPKIITVSEAERRIKAEGKSGMLESLNQVIVKPKGKATLVPVSDKRESLNTNLLAELNNIDI